MSSGTISFGLVAIPIKVYSTSEGSATPKFNMVHKTCGTRLQYRYYCPTDDEMVERDEIVKGYEFTKGQYVLFSKEELDALNPPATHSIDIEEFVPLEQVDPVFYEKSYYLGPDKGGDRPYRLLAKALADSGRAALARYSARGKTYLVLLRPFDEGLIMQQLRYEDEIRAFSEVPVGEAEVKDSELELAMQLVEQRASEKFQPGEYEDEVGKRMWELIEKKIQGEDIVAAPQESPKAQVIDLMAALKASLGEGGEKEGKPDRKPAKRAGRKTAAKKKTSKKTAAK
jgi:DNA end-binding protein Ku